MINYVLVAHLLGAAVWTGGHLILSIALLPKILATKDIGSLMAFESKFEKLGMPALIIQIISGLWMAHKMMPSFSMWFSWDNDLSLLITIKLSLLLLTVLVALHARFRVIPTLSTETLNYFAMHIITITVLSVGFVITGSLFRTGLG